MSAENSASNNPFGTLVDATTDGGGIAADKNAADTIMTPPPNTAAVAINPVDRQINALIEAVFSITVCRSPPPSVSRPLVYMDEIAPLCQQQQPALLSIDILDQALFERLLLPNPGDFLIPNNADARVAAAVVEKRVLTYLHAAYVRNAERRRLPGRQQDKVLADACGRIGELIVRNAATAIKQPALYGEGEQRYEEQLLAILSDPDMEAETTGVFLSAVVREVAGDADEEERRAMDAVFARFFVLVRMKTVDASLGVLEPWVMPALMVFLSDRQNEELAMLLMDAQRVDGGGGIGGVAPAVVNGGSYVTTLFGDLLRLSIVPKKHNGRAEYFLVSSLLTRDS